MKRQTCKLCFRRFPSGRALGGHMRSHVASVAPPASPGLPDGGSSSTSSGTGKTVPEGEAKAPGAAYSRREYPRKLFRLVDLDFSSTFSAAKPALLQGGESESESHDKGRLCSVSPPPPPDADASSSASGTTTEEDAALCLIMLSRDSWTSESEAEEEGSQPTTGAPSPEPRRVRVRYHCGTCRKVFRSYQALGGHRAHHKKSKGCIPTVESRIHREDEADANANLHECPFCFRVFGSSQALGGHKRSHLTFSTTGTITSPPSSLPPAAAAAAKFASNITMLDLDLNLPASVDDEMELSAVSDAGFLSNPNHAEN